MILITAKTPIATLSENGISKVLQSMTEITRNIDVIVFLVHGLNAKHINMLTALNP